MTANILPVGATITYLHTYPMTLGTIKVTTVVEGRNWSGATFSSYIVLGGECVYPHQILPTR